MHQLGQQAQLITTEFVLLEVANALCPPAVREQTVRFIEGLRRTPVVNIFPASQNLEGLQFAIPLSLQTAPLYRIPACLPTGKSAEDQQVCDRKA